MMKALSIKQPWASLIVAGAPIYKPVDNPDGSQRIELAGVFLKDIENRSWPLKHSILRYYPLPQRIYVHASKKRDNFDACWEYLVSLHISPAAVMMLFGDKYAPIGAIIGEVDIMDCVTESKSPWFVGPYGFVLANAKAYEKPIPYKGQLGFFEVKL